MPEPFYLSERFDLNWAAREGLASQALDVQLALSHYREAAKAGSPSPGEQPSVIYPQIHVLSADKPTRNRTMYTTAAHKGSRTARTGQHGFTRPYPVPVIKDHQSAPECGVPASTIFGRFIDAKLVKQAETGQGHVAGLTEVTHPEGIDEMLSGRWLTGSLGSSVSHLHCSVCGKVFTGPNDIDDHPHRKGGSYKMRKGVKPGTPEAEADDAFEPVDPSDRGAQLCCHVIDTPIGYQPREYSGVIVPSDDASIVNVADTNTMPGSHFTPDGAPRQSAESSRQSAEASGTPRSALWVPMTASSRAGLSAYGERYIDLVSSVECEASRLGLLSGPALNVHLERVLGGEDALLSESAALAEAATLFAFPGTSHDPGTSPDVTTEAETEVSPGLETEVPAPGETDPGAPVAEAEAVPAVVPGSAPDAPSGPARDRAHYLSGLRGLSRLSAPRERVAREAALRRQAAHEGWSPRPSHKETTLTDLSPGFALRLAYTSAGGEEFALDWLPRHDEAARAASLALLDESAVTPHLSADEALVLRARLAPDADAAEDALLVPIDESNYPLFILVSQYGLPTGESALSESLDPEDDRRNEMPMCDGGANRKETLKHAREAFRTIGTLPALLESLAGRVAALEGAPPPVAPAVVPGTEDTPAPEGTPAPGPDVTEGEAPAATPPVTTEADTPPVDPVTSPLDESGDDAPTLSEAPATAPASDEDDDEPALSPELVAQMSPWRGLGIRRGLGGR